MFINFQIKKHFTYLFISEFKKLSFTIANFLENKKMISRNPYNPLWPLYRFYPPELLIWPSKEPFRPFQKTTVYILQVFLSSNLMFQLRFRFQMNAVVRYFSIALLLFAFDFYLLENYKLDLTFFINNQDLLNSYRKISKLF